MFFFTISWMNACLKPFIKMPEDRELLMINRKRSNRQTWHVYCNPDPVCLLVIWNPYIVVFECSEQVILSHTFLSFIGLKRIPISLFLVLSDSQCERNAELLCRVAYAVFAYTAIWKDNCHCTVYKFVIMQWLCHVPKAWQEVQLAQLVFNFIESGPFKKRPPLKVVAAPSCWHLIIH